MISDINSGRGNTMKRSFQKNHYIDPPTVRRLRRIDKAVEAADQFDPLDRYDDDWE